MSRLLVTQYQAEVEKIIRYGGSKKETTIRNAFERLLNDYCKPRNYLLTPELDFKTKFNTTVFPDGTVKERGNRPKSDCCLRYVYSFLSLGIGQAWSKRYYCFYH
jgi:hypothetical protein